MSGSTVGSGRLRVAVAASDKAEERRLAALVAQLGHELVQHDAFPDAWLTDGAADAALISPEVALGSPVDDVAGSLPEDASALQIDAALRAVAAGLTVRAAARQRPDFEPLPDEARVVLTPREIEVLAALGNGLSNKAAARRLGISPYTVKFHVESLFRKLGAASRAEAVAKGLKQQIVEL
jgi:DNA-binding CsgD family transcriptional regulator